MNSTRSTPLNIETLEKLTYERSKIWARFLNSYNDIKDSADIGLNEIEEVFRDENEEEMDSFDEAEELDVFEDEDILKDISNHSHLHDASNTANPSRALTLFRGSSKDTAKTLVPLVGYPNNNSLKIDGDDDDNDLQDLFNQTKPILVEHERKWHEAGIDRILNTFDAQKIEEKVGGWLRRNHSVVGSHRNGNAIAAPNFCTPSSAASKRRDFYSEKKCDRVGSDSESLHSVDTARYILSCRKRRDGQQRTIGTSSCTTTMTIKTFRLVKSKREALREKYACPADSDEDELRYKRRAYAKRHRYQQETPRYSDASDLSLAAQSRSIQRRSRSSILRRKQYRKRRSSSASTSSSTSFSDSTSSDDLKKAAAIKNNTQCRVLYDPRRGHKISKDRMRCRATRCVRGHNHSSMSSSSFHSAHSISNMRRNMKAIGRQGALEGDTRPCKRESECRCCKDDKLCKDTRHLADTSTEDWFVENCDSPIKSLDRATTNLRQHVKAKTSKHSTLGKEYSNQNGTDKSVPLALKKREMDKQKEKKNVILKTAQDNVKKMSKRKDEDNVACPEGSSGTRCKRTTTCTTTSAKPATKTRLQNKNRKVKYYSDEVDSDEDDSDEDVSQAVHSDDFEAELQLAIEISKKSFEKNQQKKSKLKQKENSLKAADEQMHNEGVEAHTKEKPAVKTEQAHTSKMQRPLAVAQKDSPTIANSSLKISTKPQPKSVKLQKLAKMEASKSPDIADNTFFQSASQICNSTAIANDGLTSGKFFQSKSNNSHSIGTAATVRKQAAPAVVSTAMKSLKHPTKASSTNHPSGSSSSSKSNSTISNQCPSADSDNDCTIVSSTTGSDPLQQQRQQQQTDPALRNTDKGILVYTPKERNMAPAHSFSNGFFNITEEHLSTVIGTKDAQQFLKYYIGRRRFDSNSTIYFRPPAPPAVQHTNPETSDSDDDVLDGIGQYGELYESFERTGRQS